jgi:lycopene beta-cyclase
MNPSHISIYGAGLAGLSLAYELQKTDPSHIIDVYDKKSKTELLNDPKTICFLEKDSGEFDHLLLKQWQKIRLCVAGMTRSISIAPYRYKVFKAKDLYADYFQHFNKQVTYLEKDIHSIPDNTSYDSTYLDISYHQPTLIMLGATYKLSADTDCFQSDTITILDDYTSTNACDFFFFMPINAREGLLQYVLYSNKIDQMSQFDQIVENYLKRRYATTPIHYTQLGPNSPPIILGTPVAKTRAIHIGTKAGLLNPMTGFGFTQIRQHAKCLAQHTPWNQPSFAFAKAWLALTHRHNLIGKFLIQSSILLPKSLLLHILM